MKNRRGIISFMPIMMIMTLVLFLLIYGKGDKTDIYPENEFSKDLESENIEEIMVEQNKEVPTGVAYIKLNNGDIKELYVTDVNDIISLAKDNNINYLVGNIDQEGFFEKYGITIISVILCVIFIFIMMAPRTKGQGAGISAMGKSRARLSREDNKIKLADVAGLREEKEDLEELVDFLKNPEKYTKIGARIPKGVLLSGRPGTGKTLLAKALAGEAEVPFFSISGSDFVEMLVGVGASRVRDLFTEAKKAAPCVVFIDEIDAVAKKRASAMSNGNDEREQTLNQLLVEMDGFENNQGIIVLAATNRVDILDPAILRPGRFDRKVHLSTPDIGGREDILKIHAKNKFFSEDVDFKKTAQTTAGFTGADLENLLNEAAIGAAKKESPFIRSEDIEQAFVKVGIGTERRSRIISDEEKRITAYHEAGHAILFHVLDGVGPVHSVSIIPTGSGAAGYTMPLPERDDMFYTRGRMLNEIKVLLGGRIAEEIIFDDITTGASNDIERATNLARGMVSKYGMSASLGTINYLNSGSGSELVQQKPYGEDIAGKIDSEVAKIISDCYAKAKEVILEHDDILENCAQLLLEKEKITREEFEELFDNSVDAIE